MDRSGWAEPRDGMVRPGSACSRREAGRREQAKRDKEGRISVGRGINKGEDPLVSPSFGYFSWRRKKSTNVPLYSERGTVQRFPVTLRALRDGTLLTTPPEMPPGLARPVFRSAWFAVRLLPGAPRFYAKSGGQSPPPFDKEDGG